MTTTKDHSKIRAEAILLQKEISRGYFVGTNRRLLSQLLDSHPTFKEEWLRFGKYVA